MSLTCRSANKGGFTLVEALAAVVVLGIILSSVMIVIDNCISSTINLTLKQKAFEVARENIEQIISRDQVQEEIETGVSDRYPEIEWENAIRADKVADSEMWVKVTCKAMYLDSEEEPREVELVHWLTKLSKQQMQQVMRDRQLAQEQSGEIGTELEEQPKEEEVEPEEEKSPEEELANKIDDMWNRAQNDPEYSVDAFWKDVFALLGFGQ